jgi:hypothetical protein
MVARRKTTLLPKTLKLLWSIPITGQNSGQRSKRMSRSQSRNPTSFNVTFGSKIKTGNPQWDQYLTNRWKAGEAVAKGARPEDFKFTDHVPGRTQRRKGAIDF